MKAILYCRKSTDTEDKQMMSLDAQEFELKKIAERDGIEIVKILHESMSAKAPGRPLFAEMLGLISSGKADTILCWKLDRLARNPVDGGSISWMLQLNQIKVIKTHERDYLPTDNVLLMSVEFGMSNQYVRDLSENVKRGNREKLRRGEWPNHAPYGYRNDKNTKTLKVSKKEAENVKQLYMLYATGNYSFTQLANQLGLRKSLIERVLGKTFYYGLMERDGEYYPGKHEPIISKDLYDQAQEIKAGVRVCQPRPQKLFFPYRGFMKCAECGCQLTATRKKGRYDYYYCTNGKGHCSQSSLYMGEQDTFSLFSKALTELQFDDEIIEIMYEADRERIENGRYDSEKVLADIDLRLNQIEREERKWARMCASELIDEETFKAEVLPLRRERKNLKQKRHNYSLNRDTRLGTLELTKSKFIESNRAVFDFETSNPEKQNQMLKNLLWNLEVRDKDMANFHFKSPYQTIAKAPKNGDLATLLPVRDSNPNRRYQKP